MMNPVGSFFGASFREPCDHREDAVGGELPFSVDLCERSRRFQDVEMAVEGM
jgi:hypothetical protein